MLSSKQEHDDLKNDAIKRQIEAVSASAILSRLMDRLEIGTFRRLAYTIGVPPQTLQSWRRRDAIPLPALVSIAAETGLDLEWILFGYTEPDHYAAGLAVEKTAEALPLLRAGEIDVAAFGELFSTLYLDYRKAMEFIWPLLSDVLPSDRAEMAEMLRVKRKHLTADLVQDMARRIHRPSPGSRDGE